MMTKSHPDCDRPWPRMFNNSEAGSAWKENLTIILLSPSPSISWLTENIWSVEKKKKKEKGTNIWRRKIFGQRKKWRKRGKAMHMKQGPEQKPSSPNQNDLILITSTWSSGQSKAPESWARTARMSKANGAHEILLNKMDLGGGYFTGWFF